MSVYRVPRRFWEDHALRSDGIPPTPIRTTATLVDVVLSIAELADLLEDARFYTDAGTREFGPDAVGLIASARATVRRIEATGVARRPAWPA